MKNVLEETWIDEILNYGLAEWFRGFWSGILETLRIDVIFMVGYFMSDTFES